MPTDLPVAGSVALAPGVVSGEAGPPVSALIGLGLRASKGGAAAVSLMVDKGAPRVLVSTFLKTSAEAGRDRRKAVAEGAEVSPEHRPSVATFRTRLPRAEALGYGLQPLRGKTRQAPRVSLRALGLHFKQRPALKARQNQSHDFSAELEELKRK